MTAAKCYGYRADRSGAAVRMAGHPRASLLALGAALSIHGLAAGFVWNLNSAPPQAPAPSVAVEIRVPALSVSPAAVSRAAEPLPAPPKVLAKAPRVVVARRSQISPPPSEAPPPPNQEPPPAAPQSAPPVFGATMNSVVAGESALAVPVGNTMMANSAAKGSDGPAAPYTGRGAAAGPFAPAADVYIAARAQLLHEVDSESVYPSHAKALGIEGSVEAVLDIDDKGTVVGVKVTRRAGHGFDEAASLALKQFRFKPARTNDGQAVSCRIGWKYTFVVND